MKIEVTFTEEVLGTLAANKEIAREFIMSKHPEGLQLDELHAETPEGDLEKACTVFPRENGKPFLWNYQIKGFFKEACEAMIGSEALTQEELKAARLTRYLYKSTISSQIFVSPRKIFLNLSGETSWCERPLMGETMQGKRITLARSETIPAESSFACEISIMNTKLEKYVRQWLKYGELKGMLQWRNSSKGAFTTKFID